MSFKWNRAWQGLPLDKGAIVVCLWSEAPQKWNLTLAAPPPLTLWDLSLLMVSKDQNVSEALAFTYGDASVTLWTTQIAFIAHVTCYLLEIWTSFLWHPCLLPPGSWGHSCLAQLLAPYLSKNVTSIWRKMPVLWKWELSAPCLPVYFSFLFHST